MAGPTKEFWEQRFASEHTPWDRGDGEPATRRLARRRLARTLPHPDSRLRLRLRGGGAGESRIRGHRARLRAHRDRAHAQAARCAGPEGNRRGSRRPRLAARPAFRRHLRTNLPLRPLPGPVARLRRPAAPLAQARAANYSRSSSSSCDPKPPKARSRARPTTATSPPCARCSRTRPGPGPNRPIPAPPTPSASPNSPSSSPAPAVNSAVEQARHVACDQVVPPSGSEAFSAADSARRSAGRSHPPRLAAGGALLRAPHSARFAA